MAANLPLSFDLKVSLQILSKDLQGIRDLVFDGFQA